MTIEATQSGAPSTTIESAANAIESLLDAKQPSSQNVKAQPGDNDKKQKKSVATQQEDTSHAANAAEDNNQSLTDTDEQTSEADAVDGDNQDDAQIQLPQSLEELAEAYGVDANTLLAQLKARTKIDGQEGEVALADLIKSYQLEGHLNKKSMAMAEARKAFEDQVQQRQTELAQYTKNAQILLQQMIGDLTQDFNAIDWQQLEVEDPARWAVERQKFAERQQKILQYKQNFEAQMRDFSAQEEAKQQAELVKYYNAEKETLLNKLPEWRNTEKAREEKQKIRGYLADQGFHENELSNVLDHRYILLARKAMFYDKLMQSKPQITKKVVTLPPVIKPGTTKSKADTAAEQRKIAFSKVKKTGSVKDAAFAIESLL